MICRGRWIHGLQLCAMIFKLPIDRGRRPSEGGSALCQFGVSHSRSRSRDIGRSRSRDVRVVLGETAKGDLFGYILGVLRVRMASDRFKNGTHNGLRMVTALWWLKIDQI